MKLFNFKKDDLKVVDNWLHINRVLNSLRISLFVISGICIVQLIYILVLLSSDPVVIGLTGQENLYFIGKKQSVEVNNQDLERFAETYVKLRYNWDFGDVNTVIKNITPFSTYDFIEKLRESAKKNDEFMKDKEIKQRVLINEIKVRDKDVLVTLYRVISIKGQPISSNMEVSLNLVKGTMTNFNPLGIYVNAASEFQER